MSDFKNLFDLGGKVAVVTGAAAGLGQAIGEAYAQYNGTVVLVDVNEKSLIEVVKKINLNGGKAVYVCCDVKNIDDVRNVVSETLSKFGRIDILVNNAGIGRRAMAEEMTDEQWNDVLEINLKGAFLFCREVGREMIEQGQGGRIINMASIAGLVGVTTGNINYSASKGGLIAMSRCLAIEWAKHNILVNVIAPSHVRTPLIEKLMIEKPEVEQYFLNNIPIGRLGETVDVVGPAILLAAPAGAFVTGHVFLVDGGHTAK